MPYRCPDCGQGIPDGGDASAHATFCPAREPLYSSPRMAAVEQAVHDVLIEYVSVQFRDLVEHAMRAGANPERVMAAFDRGASLRKGGASRRERDAVSCWVAEVARQLHAESGKAPWE